MAAAEELLDKPPEATLSHGHAALIETVYRMVYVMATLDRGRLLDAGRGKELEDLIAAARRTKARRERMGCAERSAEGRPDTASSSQDDRVKEVVLYQAISPSGA